MRTDKDATAAMPKPQPKPQSPPPSAPIAAKRNRYSRGERLRKLEIWVPRFAVTVVAVSALAAVVYSGGYDPREFFAAVQTEHTQQAEMAGEVEQVEQPTQPQQSEARITAPEKTASAAAAEKEPVLAVVTAPPLKSPAKMTPAGSTKADMPAASPDTSAMGSSAACAKCGVVETVVAVHGYAQPQASGYQMHIRMDDGTTRTVEQRGALAAGSRVVVERNSVRVLATPAGQG